MYEEASVRLFGMAKRVPSWLKILSLMVNPFPRNFLVRSSLIVLLCNSSGVPRTRRDSSKNGTWTSIYFFLSAILFYSNTSLLVRLPFFWSLPLLQTVQV